MAACSRCQIVRAAARRFCPCGVRPKRRPRRSVGFTTTVTKPRRSNGFNAAVSVVRSIARRLATSGIVAAVAAMMKFNEEMQKAGILLALDGLHPPSAGARVRFAEGTHDVVHEPLPQVDEVLGGYWMIRVNSQQEAVDWASRAPMHGSGVIEIRQLFEMEEFPEDVQAAAGDVPARLKEALHSDRR